VDDWAALTAALIADPHAAGAFNLTAPQPATNADFTRALGRGLHRPAVIPVPGFALRLALGEMADLLLTGQRAVPAKAQALGYVFRYPALDAAAGCRTRRGMTPRRAAVVYPAARPRAGSTPWSCPNPN